MAGMKKFNEIRKNKPSQRNIKSLISCSNIGKSYGVFEILKDITFSVNKGEKIGLIGPNGAGKSTLLKIIAKTSSFDTGKLEINGEVGYIPQEFSEEEKNLSVEELLNNIFKKRNDSLNLNETISYINKIELTQDILDKKIGLLSGGEKNKIAIIRIMLLPFDVLLLDEPTNNLDFQTLSFLEDFIKKSKKTFLIISHDREFLDRTIHKTIEIDGITRESKIYDGGFSKYLEAKQSQTKKEWSSYKDSQEKTTKLKKASGEKIKNMGNVEQVLKDKRKLSHKITEKLDKTALRGIAGKAGHQARVLKNRLERHQKGGPLKPKHKLPLKLKFETTERSGNNVFKLKDVYKKMGDFQLGPVDLSIEYGERLLIVGSNGSGKSTLIKLLMGVTNLDSGILKKGSRLEIGYLPQESNFNLKLTLLEQFLEISETEESEARKTLSRFGLEADDMNKKIATLSSGEKSRLMLASMMYKNVNCLILDEPSNHLDLEVLDSLESAIGDFQGTLIVVSHDRYFINKINTVKKITLKNGTIKF